MMDRPEMLSDRLGYPSSVGDEDYKRLATMEIASAGIKQVMFFNIDKANLASLIQRAHTAGLNVEVSPSGVFNATNVMVFTSPRMGTEITHTDQPDIGIWNLLQWAREEEIIT
jgi:hypothetical protein